MVATLLKLKNLPKKGFCKTAYVIHLCMDTISIYWVGVIENYLSVTDPTDPRPHNVRPCVQ